VIYVENGKVVLNPFKIFFMPFVPKETTELQKVPYFDWMMDFSTLPFEGKDGKHIGMKYKNSYLPFRIDFMYPGIQIKDKDGKWVDSCDACINRFDAALNNGICKKGCKPSLLDAPELEIYFEK
jgi:hypothetical protein